MINEIKNVLHHLANLLYGLRFTVIEITALIQEKRIVEKANLDLANRHIELAKSLEQETKFAHEVTLSRQKAVENKAGFQLDTLRLGSAKKAD